MGFKTANLLWLLLGLIWGGSYVAIRVAAIAMDPMAIVTMRLLIAAVILLIAMKIRGYAFAALITVLAVGSIAGLLGNALPFFLITWGEQSMSAGAAALLMGIGPVFNAAIAPIFVEEESWNLRLLAALILGLSGVTLLVWPSLGAWGGMLPALAVLGAAISYVINTIIMRLYAKGDALLLAAGSLVAASIMMAAAWLAVGAPLGDLGGVELLAVVYLGVFATALATLIYFAILPMIGVNRMAQINFIVPLAGAFYGTLLLGETLGWHMIGAAALIMGGLYFSLIRR